MDLRSWQSACIESALAKYSAGQPHFLCLATPGAGKTLMAAELARRMWSGNHIDLVICLSPSVNVAVDFRRALEKRTGYRFDGAIGAHGRVLTYQAMLSLSQDFWTIFKHHRVLIIFDEIHHCAGVDLSHANAWGQKIISDIQGRAAFTLALTGTPWRSDRIPICLSSYCEGGKIRCDFQYGLRQAVNDRVCRVPYVSLVDNDRINVHSQSAVQSFSSISELLNSLECGYQDLLENETLVRHILSNANSTLSTLRRTNKNAAGLVVCSSVSHAQIVANFLQQETGGGVDVVTYHSNNAQHQIELFKHGYGKWIVSVGMISEGTNIPRLQVCCHLSRIRTEMHFRQVLGRVLRQTGINQEAGYLFVPAAKEFVEYALRLADEVPSSIITKTRSLAVEEAYHHSSEHSRPDQAKLEGKIQISLADVELAETGLAVTDYLFSQGGTPPAELRVFGRFRAELLSFYQDANIHSP